MDKKSSYKDLIVWQKSMDVVKMVYELTNNYPKSELFGLVSQMRRASISIPSNIAEGRYRSSKKEYRQFLFIAFGSGAELETQLEASLMLKFCNENEITKLKSILTEVMKMLNTLISKLQD